MKKETKQGLAVVGTVVAVGIIAATRAKAAPPPPPPPEKASLWGILTDADTGKPISGIEAALNSWIDTTGADGRYEFLEVEPGTYSLVFSDPQGRYETLEV